jgi:hypothetical protein
MTVKRAITLTIARVTFVIEMIESVDGRALPITRYHINGQRVEAADFDRGMRMVEMGAQVSGPSDGESDDTSNPIT